MKIYINAHIMYVDLHAPVTFSYQSVPSGHGGMVIRPHADVCGLMMNDVGITS